MIIKEGPPSVGTNPKPYSPSGPAPVVSVKPNSTPKPVQTGAV
jgi:hypothetical protein